MDYVVSYSITDAHALDITRQKMYTNGLIPQIGSRVSFREIDNLVRPVEQVFYTFYLNAPTQVVVALGAGYAS